MGLYVYIQVSFPCDENEPVAALAREHLKALFSKNEDALKDGEWEAKRFLEDLAQRKGTNPGPKGGLSLWGMVGNYTRVDTFVEVLKPFWHALLTDGDRWPTFVHRIVVLYQRTDADEPARAYEVRVEEIARGEFDPEVKVAHHDLPFSWVSWVNGPEGASGSQRA